MYITLYLKVRWLEADTDTADTYLYKHLEQQEESMDAYGGYSGTLGCLKLPGTLLTVQ